MAASRMVWGVVVGVIVVVTLTAVPVLALLPAHVSPGSVAGPGANDNGVTAPNSNATYAVTFSENGLPAGTNWTVQVAGAWSLPPGPGGSHTAVAPGWNPRGTNTSNSSTIGFELVNGSYRYEVSPAFSSSTTYYPSPLSGGFTVNGSTVSVSVTFSPIVFHQLSFQETGLPAGTFWSVGLGPGLQPGPIGPTPVPLRTLWGGGAWSGSNTTTVNFTVLNGNYSFLVPDANASGSVFVPSPPMGSVVVNGTNVTVKVTFSRLVLWHVAFTETGLPSGTNWSVELNGTRPGWTWNGSASPTVNFTLPNGTYNFSVPNATRGTTVYVPTPAAGPVTVSGGNVTVPIVFRAETVYTVTFAETGLPAGTDWSVLVYNSSIGGFRASSTNASINLTLANGSYSFLVRPVFNDSTIYVPTPATGTVLVAGANLTVAVRFAAPVLTNVTFVETGLPNGTSWFAAVVAPTTSGPGFGWTFRVSNTTTISFALPNGTYGFGVGPAFASGTLYVPSPTDGSLDVNGTSLTIDIQFTAATSGSGSSVSVPYLPDA